MHPVDPVPAQVRQRRQVCLLGQDLGLEAAHLAGGGCMLRHSPLAGSVAPAYAYPPPAYGYYGYGY
jgi:hypothetical protein